MDVGNKDYPFFSDFDNEIKKITQQPIVAKDELIARNAVFYKKTLFRAFLHLEKKECDRMTLQEYMDYSIMLEEVLKLIHAPYLDHNN